jgi:hypothetical protein
MIQAGENIVAEDFINASEKDATPSNDEGRVPKLEDDGRISPAFLNGLNTIEILAGQDLIKGNSIFIPEGETIPRDFNLTTSSALTTFGASTYYSSNTYTTPAIGDTILYSNFKVYFDTGSKSTTGTDFAQTTLYIYAVDGSNKPTGSPLFTSNVNTFDPYNAGGVHTLTFASPCELSSNTKYAFVLKYYSTDTDQVILKGGGSPVDFVAGHSSTDGTTWTAGYGAFYLKADLYVKDLNKAYKTDAKYTNSTSKFKGIVLKDALEGEKVIIQTSGAVDIYTGMTIGDTYYLSDTAGTIATTTGTISRVVGKAISDTAIRINDKSFSDAVSAPASGVANYDMFLYGYTTLEADDGDSATATIKVDGVTIFTTTANAGSASPDYQDEQNIGFCIPVKAGSSWDATITLEVGATSGSFTLFKMELK